MNIIKLDSVNSTNTYCNYKLEEAKKNGGFPFAVISKEQYAGRGRFGKDFYSPANTGIYLSYACEGKYEVDDLLKITIIASAITHQILKDYSKDELTIKWINDIYRGNKKIAGILPERVDDKDNPNKYYIIIGIGINVYPNNIPAELSEIAGFLVDDNSNPNLIEIISEKLIYSINDIFKDGSTTKFSELIDYYKKYCYNLPVNFIDEK